MRYKIYRKDGSTVRCETEKLEYNGQFMGDSSITASVKSNVHIAFEVGDYITYRGNNFTLGNIPTEKKTGHKNANGEVFQYDSMKFESYITELANADFNDFVGDSQTDISFTAQPNFSFVAATIDDLLQRIQVNMNRYYTGTKQWTIKADSTYTTPDDYTNMLITVSNISCWDALAYVNSKYGVNFIVRGRTVTVGTAGSVKDITFKVGRYKGLYDMTRNSQTDQQIVTRLKSYGNTTNINPRYYSLVGATVTAKLTTFDYIASSYSLFFLFDLNHTTELNDTVKFNISGSSTSYELQGTWGIYKDYTFGDRGMAESFAAYKVDTTSAIYEDVKAKVLSVGYANTSVTFVSGVRKDNISDLSHLSFDANSKLPNNMNIANLMLPSFPTGTLADWVEANKSKYTWLQDYINAGYTFSTEKYYPYINSKNVTDLGVRPHTEYFTSEDDTHKDIYPSLQYFSDDRNQVVGATASDGSAISDSGVFADGASVDPFYIIINDLGFEFDDVAVNGTSPKIHFNSGYCGGRDFTVSSWTKDGTTWKLKCARIKDDSIGKYFPYVDAPIKKGDKFVITDIYMPDTYIEQASVTLLKWSLKWLAKNDYSVFSYQLTPDINFIKRHDDAVTDKSATFHYTIMEGDVLLIEDTYMGVTGSITIDNIKITEGDGLLPKYEITLRDTKTVGTVQKIQQQIDTIVSGGVSGGYNSTQVGEIAYSALKDKFLSKVSADTAKGLITFLQGLLIGDGKYSIDKDGNAKLLSLLINSLYGIDKNGNATLNSVLMGSFEHLAQGLGLYKNSAGHWCIECDDAYFRMKAVFEQLEIRKMYSSAGNINISPSGSKISRVEWLDASGNVTTVATDTVAYKCYFLADDGTTATTNSWQAKDYALCKTFDIKEGVYANVSNQYYWRKVTDAGSGYITLGNVTGQYDTGSTVPQSGDSVVMRGSDTDGRMSYIEILSNDDNAPAILMWADCMGFASKGQNTAIISPEKVEFATKVFRLIDYDNVATPVVIYKGAYADNKVYYYNNSVTYNGSLWVLDGVAVGASAAAGTEPVDGSAVWTKQISKGVDGNGISSVTRMYITSTAAPGSGSEPTDSTTYVWASYADAIAGGAGSNGHAWDATWKYLYCREVTVYTDGTRNVVISLSSIFVVNGNDGDDGKSAPYLVLTMDGEQRDTVTLSTADNGLVSGTLTDGNAYVTLASQIKIGYTIVNGTRESGSSPEYVGTNCILTTTAITKLATQSITYTDASNNTQTAYINVTEATVIISVPLADGTTITGTYHIKVDVSRYTGGIYWDNKTFRTGYESWKTDVDGTLTDYQSSISDNADSISAEVTSRENADSVLTTSVGTISAKADAISLSVANKTSEKLNLIPNSFPRAVSCYYGGYTRSMYLAVGTYILSACGRVNSAMPATRSLKLYLFDSGWAHVFSLNFDSTTASACNITNFSRTKDTTLWTTINITVAGVYTVDFYDYKSDDTAKDTTGGRAILNWMCLTAGTVRLHWSRCASDTEVGTNMLPAFFVKWNFHNGTVTSNGYKMADGANVDVLQSSQTILTYSASTPYAIGDYVMYTVGTQTLCYKCIKAAQGIAPTNTTYWTASDNDYEILQHTTTVEAKKTYTLSFYAKGSGTIYAMLFNGSYSVCQGAVGSQGQTSSADNGVTEFQLSTAWTRMWVTFTTDTVSGSVNLWLRGHNTFASYIAGVKLEEGGLATDGLSKSDLLASGIDITSHKILATSDNFYLQNNSGQLSAAVDESGNLSAGSLSTMHSSGSPYIFIKDGIMEVHGNTAINIRFGVNANGMAVLRYYDNSGKLLYDLGPSGITSSDLAKSQWEEVAFVSIVTIGYTESTVPAADTNVMLQDAEKLFTLNSIYNITTLYRYHAGMVNGVAVKDAICGFADANSASAADGMLFTAKYAGNLCTGTYTQNNGSYIPMSVDKNYYKEFVSIVQGAMTSKKWLCSSYLYQTANSRKEI